MRPPVKKRRKPPNEIERPVAPVVQVWRRLHGGQIIAEVTPNTGMGLWRVSAYRVNGRAGEVAYTGRAFSLLIDAHRAADQLVQEQFQHVCETGVCGRWLRWPQKNAPGTG